MHRIGPAVPVTTASRPPGPGPPGNPQPQPRRGRPVPDGPLVAISLTAITKSYALPPFLLHAACHLSACPSSPGLTTRPGRRRMTGITLGRRHRRYAGRYLDTEPGRPARPGRCAPAGQPGERSAGWGHEPRSVLYHDDRHGRTGGHGCLLAVTVVRESCSPITSAGRCRTSSRAGHGRGGSPLPATPKAAHRHAWRFESHALDAK